MSDILQLHAVFFGFVQGVFFRATAEQVCKDRKLTGTVRNLKDGSVELYAQGPKEDLESVLTELKSNKGPGKVDRVETRFSPVEKSFVDFKILRTE